MIRKRRTAPISKSEVVTVKIKVDTEELDNALSKVMRVKNVMEQTVVLINPLSELVQALNDVKKGLQTVNEHLKPKPLDLSNYLPKEPFKNR